jgi:hypothetical protein
MSLTVPLRPPASGRKKAVRPAERWSESMEAAFAH